MPVQMLPRHTDVDVQAWAEIDLAMYLEEAFPASLVPSAAQVVEEPPTLCQFCGFPRPSWRLRCDNCLSRCTDCGVPRKQAKNNSRRCRACQSAVRRKQKIAWNEKHAAERLAYFKNRHEGKKNETPQAS